MLPPPTQQRFSRNRVGAAYPLKPDEILQARSALSRVSGVSGRFFLRVTRDAHREQAEYWLDSPCEFVAKMDELPHELMQQVAQSLADLQVAAEGYNPAIDANDSGRSIIFWKGRHPVTVFIPSHPAAAQPSLPCIMAFDRLWSIITKPA